MKENELFNLSKTAKYNMKRINKQGFTIVELVIAMAVIAILAAVAIPTYKGVITKANISADTQTAKSMNTALSFYTENEIENMADAKIKLYENGIDPSKFKPRTDGHEFYYVEDENKVLLYDENSQKVIFPKEFEGRNYNSDTWITIDGIGNKTDAEDFTSTKALNGDVDLKGASINITVSWGDNFTIGAPDGETYILKNPVCDEYVKSITSGTETKINTQCIGLISSVPAGAEVRVKNMIIDGAIIGETGNPNAEFVGIIAGKVEGKLTIENVTIKNSVVFGKSMVGALVGAVVDNGQLILNNVTLENTVVKGVTTTAALIGQANENITATNLAKSTVSVKISNFNLTDESPANIFIHQNGNRFIFNVDEYAPHLTEKDCWGTPSIFNNPFDDEENISYPNVETKNLCN